MSTTAAYSATRSIEATKNYAISDQFSSSPEGTSEDSRIFNFNSNEEFWNNLLSNPMIYSGKKLVFGSVTISDWIPRIPGLSFSSEVADDRDLENLVKNKGIEIERIDGDGIRWYPPAGKSFFVENGIGMFCIPSEKNDGSRIVSICDYERNANLGIPLFLTPEFADLRQGDVIDIECNWVQAEIGWTSGFAITNKIPRGHLTVQTLRKREYKNSIYISPCTIMQYQHEDMILYDYVFCTVDTGNLNYRGAIENFFEEYRTFNGRNGKYLLPSDANNPLFDSEFNSPIALRQKAGRGSQLDLVVERIRNSTFKGMTIDAILRVMQRHYLGANTIYALARFIGIIPAQIEESSSVDMSAQLIDLCIEQKKMEELIDRISFEHKGAFSN